MKCLYPLSLRMEGTKVVNYRYKRYQTVSCGRCINCRVNRQSEWSTRILNEKDCWPYSIFFTLTYSDVNVEPLNKSVIRKFNKYVYELNGFVPRHYISGELGETTFRPHYHGVFFNLDYTRRTISIIDKAWHRGHVSVSPLTAGRAKYVCKYILKYDSRQNNSISCKTQGLGFDWLQAHRGDVLITGTVNNKSIPRSYRRRLYTDSDTRRFALDFEINKMVDYMRVYGHKPADWQLTDLDVAEATRQAIRNERKINQRLMKRAKMADYVLHRSSGL